MNILLIHQPFLEKDDAGGSRFNEMTRIWAAEGHQVTVLGGMVNYTTGLKREKYKGKFTLVEQYEENIKVIRCYVSSSYNVNFIGRLWGYFSFVFSSIYAGLFKARDKYDLILVTSPPLFVGITAYVLSRWKRIPFIFEIRDLWPESAIDTGVLTNKPLISLMYGLERFVYKKAKQIVVLTPAFRKALIEKKGIKPEKIDYIPNACDFELSEELLATYNPVELRTKLGVNDKYVITYVGAHGVANHLIQVIETAEILRDNDKVAFLLIGEGMQKKMLQEEVQKRNLKNVIFIDSVPKKEVFKYILASDAGMSVLKKVDTFKTVYSNKTFDYMACKKITFMLIDGVSRELIEESKAGIYVEPENPAAFASTIVQYLGGESFKDINGENGYQFAKGGFDRDVLAKKYLVIMKTVK